MLEQEGRRVSWIRTILQCERKEGFPWIGVESNEIGTFSAAAARVQAIETPRIALAPSFADIRKTNWVRYTYLVFHQVQSRICQ
jgi:hypothetical protein